MKKAIALILVLSVFLTLAVPALAANSDSMCISDAGVDFLCSLEGFHSTCYRDYSQSSIGYGTRCGSGGAHATGSHSISREEAMNRLRSALSNTYEPRVRRQTSGLDLTQNQYDVLVSLCYNCGGGNSAISNSPLVQYLRGQLTESEARAQYANYYVNAGGKRLQGLVNRRNKEADRFFSGSSNDSGRTVADGTYMFKSALGDFAVDLCGASMDDGAQAVIWELNYGGNQYIDVTYVGNGLYKLAFHHSGKALDVQNAGGQGSSIIQWEYHGGSNQLWRIHYIDGTYVIQSASGSNLVLEIYGGYAENGRPIAVWEWHGGWNQRFYLVPASGSGASDQYFPRCASSCSTITIGLGSIGVNSSYSYRKQIAAANAIEGYRGTADQNNLMLRMLKEGRLRKP